MYHQPTRRLAIAAVASALATAAVPALAAPVTPNIRPMAVVDGVPRYAVAALKTVPQAYWDALGARLGGDIYSENNGTTEALLLNSPGGQKTISYIDVAGNLIKL